MKLQHLILSALTAVTVAVGLAVPAFAYPAQLTGNTPGSRVNVRTRPTVNSPAQHYGLVGDRVDIRKQTPGQDGHTWYYVEFTSGAQGWIRGDYIRSLAQGGDGYPIYSGILNGGYTGARINVRSQPTTQSTSPHYGLDGDRVQVLNQTIGRDGHEWYYIQFRSGAEGWVRGDLIDIY